MSFLSEVASTGTPSPNGGRSFVLQGSRGRGRASKATRGYAATWNFGAFGTRAEMNDRVSTRHNVQYQGQFVKPMGVSSQKFVPFHGSSA